MGINRRAETAVSHPEQRPVVFDGAEDSISQVLSHHCRRSQIAVVRNVDKHVRSLISKGARNSRMRGLDANKNPGAQVAEGHQRVRAAGNKFTDDSTYRTRAR